jgi:CubicO group peptidase (beta-lactamase class C family)
MGARHEIHGTCEPEFSAVREAFADNFEKRGEAGAAVAVYVGGRPVVDLWGGFSDAARTRPWERDTIAHVYSVTKPMAAACALVLADRGLLDLDAPVARYWPEFARAGKEGVLVRWLLTHQAGVPALREPAPTEVLYDWERTTSLLAAEEPWWEPGTRHGEHALFFGHLVGEVVRRVAGKSLGAFYRDEVAGPLGLDFHIGLGAGEERRAAELTAFPISVLEKYLAEPGSLRYLALNNPPALFDPAVVNGRRWRAAEVPAVNGHGTARAVARFYGALAAGGELDGVRVLSAQMLERAMAEACEGVDEVLGFDVRWGLGFQAYEEGPFGLGGVGGSDGFGNRALGFGYGYVTNTMGDHARTEAVVEALEATLRGR